MEKKQAPGSFETQACFDGSTLYQIHKNHFFSLFIHWPGLFLSKPFPCLVLSTLHHVFASIGQVSSLTPPLPHTLPHPRLSSYLKKNKIIMVNNETI